MSLMCAFIMNTTYTDDVPVKPKEYENAGHGMAVRITQRLC